MLFNSLLILSVIGVGAYLLYCSYVLVRDDDTTDEGRDYLTEDEIINLIRDQLLAAEKLDKGFIQELDDQNINYINESNVLNVDFNEKVIKNVG